METLGILAEHYRETCDLVRLRERRRERLLLLVALILALLLLQLQGDESTIKLAEDVAKGVISPENISANFAIIKGLLWVILALLVHAYYQVDISIERLYPYIHAIEGQINGVVGGRAFTREGKSYDESYPLFLSWTWIFYKWLVPLVILVIPLSDFVVQMSRYSWLDKWVIFRFVILMIIAASTILYAHHVHFQRKSADV
jgi:hypothetical protein